MSAIQTSTPLQQRTRVPLAMRGAQTLFLIPLGLLQLVAAVVFGITDGVRGGQYAIGVWAVAMALAGIAVALGLGRGGDQIRRFAFTLLAAQALFSLVKLTVYHESASYVFFGITAVAAALLSASRDDAR